MYDTSKQAFERRKKQIAEGKRQAAQRTKQYNLPAKSKKLND